MREARKLTITVTMSSTARPKRGTDNAVTGIYFRGGGRKCVVLYYFSIMIAIVLHSSVMGGHNKCVCIHYKPLK